MVKSVVVGLALVLMSSPAAADVGEPVTVAAPGSIEASYRFFEPRGNAQTPGAYWNPCRTITYGIDFRTASRRGLNATWEKQRWQSVIEEVSDASGLTFRYVGTIRTRSLGSRPQAVRGVDIPITYGTQRTYGRALRGSIAGVAGVSWDRTHLRGRKQITSGYVVIDADEVVRHISSWRVPFDSRPALQRNPDTLRALYMHEFGHAVGMEHVRNRGQIMYPTLSASRPDVLGSGDLTGLRKLGSQRCF